MYSEAIGFRQDFDKMNDVDKRKLIESMIAEYSSPKETWKRKEPSEKK